MSCRLKILESFGSSSCIFCRSNVQDIYTYGKIYQLEDVVTHYFCMLFSMNIEQNGRDEDGILGFFLSDIRKGIAKSRKITCSYCHQDGASISCVYPKCKKWYHFPCGISNGSLHQFYGRFRSFCYQHRRPQAVPASACKPGEKSICLICREDIRPHPAFNTIWAPCCKSVWYHKFCIQRMAESAGYFFRCPNCNNQDTFRKEMQECGVYIPDQDASWELEPNAFQELERLHRCNYENCTCPRGRDYAPSDGIWMIRLCHICGSDAIHAKCGEDSLGKNKVWICRRCTEISETLYIKKANPGPPAPSSQSAVRSRFRRSISWAHKRKKKKNISHPPTVNNSSDSEVDIKKTYLKELTPELTGPSTASENINRSYEVAGNTITTTGLTTTSTVSSISREKILHVINLLEDSDDESTNNDAAFNSSIEIADNKSASDDDEVIFVGSEVPDCSTNDITSAKLRIVANDKAYVVPASALKNKDAIVTSPNTSTEQNKQLNMWQPVPFSQSILRECTLMQVDKFNISSMDKQREVQYDEEIQDLWDKTAEVINLE